MNYGNSPVGEIMKDTSITDKDAAINDFKSTHVFSGVTSNLNYYTEAWSSYVTGNTVYNGDEDPTAIFVFKVILEVFL